MPTIVVTGATGFLGRCLMAYLAEHDMTVIPVSRRRLPGVCLVRDYLESPVGDVLIHLAEEPDRGMVNRMGDDYVERAASVIAALSSHPNQRVVYVSSGVVYGDGCEPACKVGATVMAEDAYSKSKLLNERIVLDAGGGVARLSNLFGFGMSENNVVSDIIRQVPGAGPLMVRDDKPVRDYLHVSDAVSAMTLLVKSGYRGIVNVGSGVGTSVRKLAELALVSVGQGARDIVATAPSSRRSTNVLDISETTKLLGWQPVARLEEQLPRLIHDRTDI
jgi:UDP-glucose 4-epimerase